jgi:hypothetical protein
MYNKYGVLVDWEGEAGMGFTLFHDIEDAIAFADDSACNGFDAKLFEYDEESKQYMEYYS